MYIPCQWRDRGYKKRRVDRTDSEPENQEEQEATGHKTVLEWGRTQERCKADERKIEMKSEGNKNNQ